MIVLGFDPGYAIIGYGAIEHSKNKSKLITYGVIRTDAGKKMYERLNEIYLDTRTIIEKIRPDTVCLEELFFNTNQKTGINVAHARGVLMLACAQAGLEPYEYTPLQVKQAVVGYGRAEKKQVMEMTRLMLNLDKIPRPDDAADALAIAICHAHSMGSALSRL